MKKLWIQYLVLIVCGAVMLCCFPPFAEQIRPTQAEVDWQSDEYVNDFGDLVLPLPEAPVVSWEASSSEDTVTSLESLSETSALVSSAAASSAIASSKRTSSAASKPTVSSKPVSSAAIVSSKPVSSAASSSKPASSAASSSKPVSSAASSQPISSVASAKPVSSAATSSQSKEEKLLVNVGGKVVEYTPAELLPRIAEAEIGSSSPEAIKAQVIAAHTFIRYYNDQGSAPTVAQKNPTTTVKNAAAEVLDLIMTVNGKPVYTPYCAATAGRTNSSAEVWGGTLSHLQSVESKYDHLDTKNWGSKKTIAISTVREKLEAVGITVSGEPSTWFEVINYTAGGYNKNMKICGQTSCTISGKKKTITGRIVRENILGLKSAKFEVTVSGDNLIFTTYGYGHGVGLSQMGAHYYAKEAGWSYEQILTHYYTGVKLVKYSG